MSNDNKTTTQELAELREDVSRLQEALSDASLHLIRKLNAVTQEVDARITAMEKAIPAPIDMTSYEIRLEELTQKVARVVGLNRYHLNNTTIKKLIREVLDEGRDYD